MSNNQYRHEYKYLINSHQKEQLEVVLSTLMRVDLHVIDKKSNLGYSVKSLYFDDYFDSALNDNINGIEPREKFRIRTYSSSSQQYFLELKRKEFGMTLKERAPLSIDDVFVLLNGGKLNRFDSIFPIINKFSYLQEYKLLQPKIITEYNRLPFICDDGNVRITIDSGIRSSNDTACFICDSINYRYIMPKGINLLEVKYDYLLPDYIYNTLEFYNLVQTTFSKYSLCRKFGGII